MPPKSPRPRLPFADVMTELEQAGSAQTRKTYARHGAAEPMFGVSFATLKALLKRIGVDHELACALWATGNFDARNLAVKVADPARLSPDDLERWARENSRAPMCANYVAMLAVEGPHADSMVPRWLAAADPRERAVGWALVGQLAQHHDGLPAAWFLDRLATIEATVHTAPNEERRAMFDALIVIGTRDPALRDAAVVAARRLGVVPIDYGDTSCETPDAVDKLDKAWAHSTAKGFASPAAHERTRERLRLRC